MKTFAMDVHYCSDADVFMGTSKEIRGLILETESLFEMIEEAMEIVPQLLRSNMGVAVDDEVEIRVLLHMGEVEFEQPRPRWVLRPEYPQLATHA